jgi:hypothetical protein
MAGSVALWVAGGTGGARSEDGEGSWTFFLKQFRKSALGLGACACAVPKPAKYCQFQNRIKKLKNMETSAEVMRRAAGAVTEDSS